MTPIYFVSKAIRVVALVVSGCW